MKATPKIYRKSKKGPRFERLCKIGWKYGLECHLPPFDGNPDECFFDIHEFKETEAFQKFIGIIDSLKIPYEYAFKKGTKQIFLTINTGDINGV